MTTDAKPKRRRPNWFLWWQVDPYEVKRQVAEYDRLKLTQSARGISMLMLMVSAGLTLVFVVLVGRRYGALFDAGVAAGIGLFVLGGNRWSKIAAMVYWTLEKLLGVLIALFGPTHGVFSFAQILWWAVFMHFFFLAYQVERARRRPSLDVEAVFS